MCTTLSTVFDGDSGWPYKSSNRSCQVSTNSLSALSQQAHHSTNIYIQWDCHIQLRNITHRFYQAKDLLYMCNSCQQKVERQNSDTHMCGDVNSFQPNLHNCQGAFVFNGHLIITSLFSYLHKKSFSKSLSKQYDGFKFELSHLALKMIQQSLSFSFAIGLDSIPKEAANKQYKK